MAALAKLAGGADDKEDENFGMNDDDWNIYKEINREYTPSDEENLDIKLNEVDLELRELDYSSNFK